MPPHKASVSVLVSNVIPAGSVKVTVEPYVTISLVLWSLTFIVEYANNFESDELVLDFSYSLEDTAENILQATEDETTFAILTNAITITVNGSTDLDTIEIGRAHV